MRRFLVLLLVCPTLLWAESPPAPVLPTQFSAGEALFCIEPDVGPASLDFTTAASTAQAVTPGVSDDLLAAQSTTVQFVRATQRPARRATRTIASRTAGQRAIQPTQTLSAADGGVADNVPGCTQAAYDSLPFTLPPGLPQPDLPGVAGCDFDECVRVRRAWIIAHHHAWQAVRIAEWLASHHPSQRSWAWDRRGIGTNGEEVASGGNALADDNRTALEDWFGPYSAKRAEAIIDGLRAQWSVLHTGRTGGRVVNLFCDHDVSSVGAHNRRGRIKFGRRFFGEFRDSEEIQTQAALHEPLHWIWVDWGNITSYLRDTWSHAHGRYCLIRPIDYMVNESEVRHLAHYDNGHGGNCGHTDQAARNIQNYTFFTYVVGWAVAQGRLVEWPTPSEPTPTPPTCDAGELGCPCSETFAFGEGSTPDGDFQIDRYCDDDDSDHVCVATDFGAGNTHGICTACEAGNGAPGCPCESDGECAVDLLCWGEDTQNGSGIGRCYDASPPSWACLADCQTLFASAGAWCDHDDLLGATCYDLACDNIMAETCREAGAKCKDGVCMTEICTSDEIAAGDNPTCAECNVKADCDGHGYPEIFECIGHQCRRPDGL